MTEFKYTYSKSVDFGGSFAAGQFATEVASSAISANFERVDTDGDDVDVVFSASLTAGEVTTLDGLVSSHTPGANNLIMNSDGYVDINSTLADNAAVLIRASDAAGGIDIDAGSGGIAIDSGNVVSIDAGALVNITTTSGNIELDTPGLVDLNGQSGVNIGNDADAAPVNIGTGAASKAVSVGNATGSSSVTVNTGTGGMTVTTASSGDFQVSSGNTLQLAAVSDLTIDSTGGLINLGNGANNENINIGTAGSRVVTIGNTGSSSAVNIVSGTWGVTVGNDSSSGEIQVAASANAKTVKIGNDTGGSRLMQKWGAGGFIQHQAAHTALPNGNSVLTTAQLLSRILTITPSVNRTLTLPSAAAVVSAVSGVRVDDCFDFSVINLGQGASDPAVTVAAGAGGATVGFMVVEPHTNNAGTYFYSGAGEFRLRLTNVTASSEAYVAYRIG
jgi:hypothetical protein